MTAAGVAFTILLTSGCGPESLQDQMIIGKNRIYCDNIPITVTTPFELGSDGKQVDLADHSADKATAEGHNRYLQIFVTGNKLSDSVNAKILGEEAVKTMENSPEIAHLKTERKTARVGDSDADVYQFSFTEKSKLSSTPTPLSVIEYIFEDGNTVWRVIYQYRSEDPVGKAMAEEVAGKITLGATF